MQTSQSGMKTFPKHLRDFLIPLFETIILPLMINRIEQGQDGDLVGGQDQRLAEQYRATPKIIGLRRCRT